MTWLDQIIEWVLMILLLGIVGAGVYLGLFTQFQKIEAWVLEKMSGYASEIYDYLDRMFKRRTINECYIIILAPTIFFAFMGLVIGILISIPTALIMMLMMGFIGFRLPRIVVKGIFDRRVAKFDRQLVDALNMMANAVKSGLSFLQVIQVIEQEMPNPCAQEFGMVLKENRVGVNINDALMNMTRRMPSEDLFMIINSVVTLSQQGGDISEAFEVIAETIRERQRVADKIRTMAEAGLTQGAILSALPFVMLGLQFVIQPDYVKLLFTTPLGWVFLLLVVVLISTGAFWMKKILTIDI